MEPREWTVLSVAERLLWRARRPPLPEAVARAARRRGPGGEAEVVNFQRRLAALARRSGAGVGPLLGAEPVVSGPASGAAALAAADLARLLGELSALYGLEPKPRRWRLELAPVDAPERPPARTTWSMGPVVRPSAAPPDVLESLLERLLGLPGFRPGQAEALERALLGRDSLLVLPTGGGKSLVYQLAALLLPGTCLVVEPTLSLIEDQRARLARLGITRVIALTGEPKSLERRRRELPALASGEAFFCFVSPERLQTDSFRACLRRLSLGAGLSLIAIDEAHCVSEWGHDFRPAYLSAGTTARRLAAAGGNPVPLLAVTGTLAEAALPELRQALALSADSLVAPAGLSPPRPELAIRVRRCESRDKPAELARLLDQALPEALGTDPLLRPRGRESACGILFCPHVEGPFGTRAVADGLRARAWPVDVYHGRPPRGRDAASWAGERAAAARRFLGNRATLLVATKAFGIGIDKPNIRYTVHYGLPSGSEAFDQESGRAGRDGRKAECWILASIADAERAHRWLSPDFSPERLSLELEGLAKTEEDDLSRALAMHLHSFPGVERELEDARQVLRRLGDWRRSGVRIIRLGSQHRALVEKALHRLICLGVVSDYTIEWRDCAYIVRLPGTDEAGVAARLRERLRGLAPVAAGLEEALRLLLENVYATIERRRRASLAEILARCLV